MYVCGKGDNGQFKYELYTGTNEHVETVTGFATVQEAERAAQLANRGLILHPDSFVPASGEAMTLDDILAELTE